MPTLEEGRQYKFLGVLETLVQEEKMVLELAAKEYLRRLSVIWSSPLSDYNRVVASNQFALPVLGYLIWTQHWPVTDLKIVNHLSKKVMTIEMSCPRISNRKKKSEEKTMKYGPLRWELKEKYKGYEMHQYNIIMDVLGGWSEETEISVQSLVGRKTTQYCKNFQSSNMMMLIPRLID